MGQDTTTLPLGKKRWLWPFELIEQIGEGGMGVVYRARYVVKNVDVAVKMVPSDVSDPTTLARFEREMEVLKTLKHPHIVRTFGGVCEDKQRFYAMELIPGGSLEDVLRLKGRLPWEQVIEYGMQMCAALGYLHGQGIVHRDIKPSNFLLAKENRLKLSDFGLASVMAHRKITAEGRTAGTFLYMAPEQIRGESVTAETDLYALGCVLFELLTGQPPFIGDTPAATLHMHCKSPAPRVTERAMDVPMSLDRIVMRLLEKEPSARYHSAEEVARDLSEVTQTIEILSPRTTDLKPAVSQQPLRTGAVGGAKTEVLPKLVAAIPGWTRHIPAILGVGAVLLIGWIVAARFVQGPSRQSYELWLEAASRPEAAIRVAAVDALSQIAEPDGLKVVANRLASDSDLRVRAAAAAGLGRAGKPAREFIPDLLRAQRHETERDVRAAVDEALRSLQQK